MAIKIARGQVTIIDQNDAVSLQSFIGSNQPLTQIFNKDADSLEPDWNTTPFLVLTPSLFVSVKGVVDQITTVGNSTNLTPGVKPGSVKWYKEGNVIISGEDNCIIGTSATKYALTVKMNHMSAVQPQVKYTFEAIYIDGNGLEIPFRTSIQFTQHQTAGAVLCAIAYAPDGVIFRNEEVNNLRAHCDLWRGSVIDDTDVQYYWGIKDSSVFVGTRLSEASPKGSTEITCNSITNMEAGGKLIHAGSSYIISSVNLTTKVVTLTTGLSAEAKKDDTITSPYYTSSLGPGWALISSSNQRGILSGWTTNEITITPDAVLNFETFKCAIKDTDTRAGNVTANQVVCDIISFSDMSDPIMVDIVSQKGFTIKNNSNDVDAKAVLYRNGEELDETGTNYTYTWKLWNSGGTEVTKTYTGKSIVVSKDEVRGKGVLMAEVSK